MLVPPESGASTLANCVHRALWHAPNGRHIPTLITEIGINDECFVGDMSTDRISRTDLAACVTHRAFVGIDRIHGAPPQVLALGSLLICKHYTLYVRHKICLVEPKLLCYNELRIIVLGCANPRPPEDSYILYSFCSLKSWTSACHIDKSYIWKITDNGTGTWIVWCISRQP